MNSSSRFTIVSRISLIPFCVAYSYIVPHIEIIQACGVMRSDKSCSLCSNLALNESLKPFIAQVTLDLSKCAYLHAWVTTSSTCLTLIFDLSLFVKDLHTYW